MYIPYVPISNPNPNFAGDEDDNDDAVTTVAFSLGNYVWIDSNHDGIQNEPAASGVNGAPELRSSPAPRLSPIGNR